jgi:hypothetical protein
MTILTRWEPFREFLNRMNRLFRESYNPQARGWHRGRNLCVGRHHYEAMTENACTATIQAT